MDPVPPLADDNCLLLDLDGTLLHLREDPAAIPADPALLKLLANCAARLDGRGPHQAAGRARFLERAVA